MASEILFACIIYLSGRTGAEVDTSCYFWLPGRFLQTFLNNIPEGNRLKSVYLTPKIAYTFRHMWSLTGRVAYTSLSSFSQ